MICPKCYAEYLEHISDCGDCKVSLIDACLIDLPIPEMTWKALPAFQGKIYADMVAEILDKNDIPYYEKMDWSSSAYIVTAANLPGQIIRIFVPEKYLNKASKIVSSITGVEK
tara:strand:+ start:314 stop:652 length:339 start_codon:yes stop_codon:yes gene_type:complete